ncbi:MAG TPA: hypothetical protein PL110_08320 [Candidatus Eremiobacteraeota bacterium]|nr:MAG: hypothetical protein BWY64_02446 [bacterium ADurb.Bin363]HPZ08105.1 hypothetical protein [Candidatus Eremiobacteraeota bacterium]
MAIVNTYQSNWQIGGGGRAESPWKASPKEGTPVLKDTADQVVISQEGEEPIDEQEFLTAMKKLQEFKSAVWFEFDKKSVDRAVKALDKETDLSYEQLEEKRDKLVSLRNRGDGLHYEIGSDTVDTLKEQYPDLNLDTLGTSEFHTKKELTDTLEHAGIDRESAEFIVGEFAREKKSSQAGNVRYFIDGDSLDALKGEFSEYKLDIIARASNMTKDELTASLKKAGFSKGEIKTVMECAREIKESKSSEIDEKKKYSKEKLVDTLSGLDFSMEEMQIIANNTSRTGQQQFAKAGLKTMKNSFTDVSRDGLIAKIPSVVSQGGQIALMIAAGSLVPPLLPALGLGALGIALNMVFKDVSKKVQLRAQAKALSEITGVEQKYIEHSLKLEQKAAEQNKHLNKFITKAMQDEGMDKWVTDMLTDAENEECLAALAKAKNLPESFGQMIKRNIFGAYQPEAVQARDIFAQVLLRGLLSKDKDVEAFLQTQPEKRQTAVREKAKEFEKLILAQQKTAQAEAVQTPQQTLNEQQQLAVLNNFTAEFLGSEKMKEYSEKAFMDQPGTAEALYSNETSQEVKNQLALITLTKGLLTDDADVKAFVQVFASKYPESVTFLDQIVTQVAASLQQAATSQESSGITTNLSQEEQKATLMDFTQEFLQDESLKSFARDVAFKDQPQIIDALYSNEVPLESKVQLVLGAFTLGLLAGDAGVVSFNDKITPKYTGEKEQFLSQIITRQADLIQQQNNASAAG